MKAKDIVFDLCCKMENKATSPEDRKLAYAEMLEVIRIYKSGKKQLRLHIDKPEDKSFLEFWTAYPHKVAKGYAEKALYRALKETDLQTILKGVQWYKMNKPDENAWAFPASWLNAQRWLDGQSAIETVPEAIDTSDWPEWKQKIAKAFNVAIVNTWFKDAEYYYGVRGGFELCELTVPKSSYQWIKDRYQIELNRIFGNVELRCK